MARETVKLLGGEMMGKSIAELNCDIEERAAIIEEATKCSRADAENMAARLHGFKSWQDWVKARGAK